ncbi:MAG: hypothetical protein R3E09_09535 [Novosphingobium sp.]|nr:hypothetical protein [Novosphingobium sp.]
MTQQGAQIAGATAARDAASDWQALRDSGDIQFSPLPPMKPPETPGWLKLLGEWLEALGKWLRGLFEPVGQVLGVSWSAFEKVLIALAILLVLFILWRLAQPLLDRLRNRQPPEEAEWAPDREAAVALLEDADRLAAEGRFGEAVHLLLKRSVSHIAEARPDWLLPASTAREISEFSMLSDAARHAFRVIAVRVERSLFALRDLEVDDWQAARAAYSDFALQDFGGEAA